MAMLKISIATRSEPGQRTSNDDDLSAGRTGDCWYAVLADGAGGHRHGAEAARIAIDALEAAMHQPAPPFAPDYLTQAVLDAHAQVQQHQDGGDERARMHSTLVALWIDAPAAQALWTHVGDSRLYLLRDGSIEQVTVDDSAVQRMVDAGLLTPEQADKHPNKNQLIAALGMAEDIEPHTLHRPLAVHDGDVYLLCSDGWWDGLDPPTISRLLQQAATPTEWLTRMQQQIEARNHPRQDNYSAIALWVGEPPTVIQRAAPGP